MYHIWKCEVCEVHVTSQWLGHWLSSIVYSFRNCNEWQLTITKILQNPCCMHVIDELYCMILDDSFTNALA